MGLTYRVIVAVLSIAGSFQPTPIRFSNDGAWCWFQDERAIIHDGKLILGAVAAGKRDPQRRGNVEVLTYDLDTGHTVRTVLHTQLQQDDHDSPAFIVLADGRILAMYCKHGNENRIYYRITREPGDTTQWQAEQTYCPSQTSRVTYTNLLYLAAENTGKGRLYNFYRGYDRKSKPSWMTSDDEGHTWTSRGLVIDFSGSRNHRPYVKYAANGRDTIHFLFTEGHPNEFDNSLYHAYYQGGVMCRSDGTPIRTLGAGPIHPHEATCVFRGDPNNVSWSSDIQLDEQGRPVAVYSVQKNAAGQPLAGPENGQDLRYRYARWDGTRWHDHALAFAGTRLYPGEDDYTGNICLDPDDPKVVYLSSNVDPRNGGANASGHYEIYRGKTSDLGRSWTFVAITRDSPVDNIRPIVPYWDADHSALLWLRGTYYRYTDYDLEIVGILTGD
jgi:hypothetical protein